MPENTLSLGASYLGLLSGRLGDLAGYDIMANELIQNADDAKDATEIFFDVTDDALIVQNDGVFTDCGQQDSNERNCLWSTDAQIAHRCDFHRFRETSSHDKSKEEDVTGAFGIGFISVYQITDHPELISSKRYWQIRPELLEGERILVMDEDYPARFVGTRFILPWAFNPNSELRRQPGFEVVSKEKINELKDTLKRTLPSAMIFLKKIKKIELRENGKIILQLERIKEGNQVFIYDQEGDGQIWHLFDGSFDKTGEELKARYGKEKIHPTRNTTITLAIPHGGGKFSGLYHATLPTQEPVGLPLHINASFFPSSDRKTLLLSDGYKAIWNRTAIECAANSLAQNLQDFPKYVDFRYIWGLISQAFSNFDGKDAEASLHALTVNIFWNKIEVAVKNLPLLYTSIGDWKCLNEAYLLYDKKNEIACLPILEQIGIPIVHPDLNEYSTVIRKLEVNLFDSVLLVSKFEELGFTKPIEIDKAPNWLKSAQNRERLAQEMVVLFSRVSATARSDVSQKLMHCSLAVSIDRTICPISSLRNAPQSVIDLFGLLKQRNLFAGTDNPQVIVSMVNQFSFGDAVEMLEEAPLEICEEIWRKSPSFWVRIFKWLDDHRTFLKENAEYGARLWGLVAWPSGQNLYTLNKLAVPGDFEDPLDLALVIDSQILHELSRFLIEDLEVKPLTIETYSTTWVPKAFENPENISHEKRIRLNNILASKLGNLLNNPAAQTALANCEIVLCTDRKFYPPRKSYFYNPDVIEILGQNVPVAELPAKNAEGVRKLWGWLGVQDQPKPEDIVARIKEIVNESPFISEARRKIQKIFINVGKRWPRPDQPNPVINPDDFTQLKTLAWLPAENDHYEWHLPSKLYASYSRESFESQAKFLDIDRNTQGTTRDFIVFLGINTSPTLRQVIDHLLWCMANKKPAHRSVYLYLNNFATDREVKALQGKACLYLSYPGFEGYVSADKVFWGQHPFGKYRHQLLEGHEDYQKFYKENGVREAPGYQDAISVLKEISDGYDKTQRPVLDTDTYNIVMQCWTILGVAYDKREISDDYLTKEFANQWIIPNPKNQLTPPSYVLFEDRPKLAEKYGTWLKNIIIPKIQWVWEVMNAAGVALLNNRIHYEMISCTNPILSDLTMIFRERQELILRVIGRNDEKGWDLTVFDKLEIKSVDDLSIHSTIKFEHLMLPPFTEYPNAYYDKESQTLLYKESGRVPFDAIAREIAYALNPETEASLIAPGIKEVLTAENPMMAKETLDELGLAPLELTLDLQTPSTVGATLGVGTTTGTIESLSTTTNTEPPKTPITTPDGKDGGAGGKVPGGSSGPTGGGGSNPPTTEKKQQKFETYVYVHQDGKRNIDPDNDRRPLIDDKGMKAVFAFERASHRNPHNANEVQKNNPGYDVYSTDSGEDNILRYIEVKSTSETWGERGVALSLPQFEMALKMGERYWLYIVENALSTTPNVICIQNPAKKTAHLVYDTGWRNLAEQEKINRVSSILNIRRKE